MGIDGKTLILSDVTQKDPVDWILERWPRSINGQQIDHSIIRTQTISKSQYDKFLELKKF